MRSRRRDVMVPSTSTPNDSPIVRQWGAYRDSRRRRRPPRLVWAVLAAATLAAAGAAVWLAARPHPWRPPSGSPHFTSCTYGGYVSAWCGRLAVPEDPRRPRGRTISLRVAVLPATERPAEGALFYLEGGPGGAATASAVRVNELFAQVARNRDLVLVDQRGTGGSSRLACPRARVRAADAAAVAVYVHRCFAGLRRDPRLYTTSVAADDLDAVRRAMGYGRVDVYGGSYGATLALAFLQQHPRAVRTAVLDSGSLPDVHVYERSAANAQSAVDAVLARCAAAPACRREFPHPDRDLATLLARAPRRVTVEAGRVLLRPVDVAWTVESLTATAEGAATLPFVLRAAVRGNYLPLGRTFVNDVGADLDARARLAMFWEILCSEPWARFGAVATATSYLARAAAERAHVFGRACRWVPNGRVAGVVAAAFPGPVLLLAGGADPLDPAPNLRGWRRAFPHGRLVVVPAAGHGAIGYGCVPALVARFVARADASTLDTACVRHVPPPAFELG
ncbi:MAG: alpha/beta fold hydrolase [Gaiellaceae bacterium]